MFKKIIAFASIIAFSGAVQANTDHSGSLILSLTEIGRAHV